MLIFVLNDTDSLCLETFKFFFHSVRKRTSILDSPEVNLLKKWIFSMIGHDYFNKLFYVGKLSLSQNQGLEGGRFLNYVAQKHHAFLLTLYEPLTLTETEEFKLR